MGNIHQTQVLREMPRGKVGQLYGDPAHYVEESYGTNEGRAAEVSTIVIDTASDAELYSFELFGEPVSFLSTSTDKADITAGLLADAEDNPVITGLVTIVDDTTDTLTITARYPGINLGIKLNDNAAKMTLTEVTAENEGATLPFGRAVSLDPNSDERVVEYNATTKVVNLALTFDDGIDALVSIEVGGVTYQFEHTMATNADTSVIALADEINATLPANTVAATHPTADTLTLTGEVVGQDFAVGFGFGEGADTGAWVYTETEEATDFVGVTRFTYEEPATVIGDASSVGYPPGRDVNVLRRGRIFVEGGDSATKSSAVYIGTAAGEEGKFFDAAATGRVLIDDGSVSWHSANVIEVRKGL